MNDIESFFARILEKTHRMGGTDIHFNPTETEVTVRIRAKGRLCRLPAISKLEYVRICTHVKFLAHLDVADARFPQSGTFFKMDGSHKINIRASTLPTLFGESLALRLIYRTELLSLENLSIFPSETDKLLALLERQAGLYLFAGPTGSGKTTTMYALLSALLAKQNLNVITLEDPIEIKFPEITQVQMNAAAGLDYAQGLKAILRHDPDVILVGEIREEGTARLAVRAALTGHRVLSTIHAKDTLGALLRLFEYGIPFAELWQSVQGISAQSMHALYCPLCAGPCENAEHPMYRQSVTCLYEILIEKELHQAFQEIKEGKTLTEPTHHLRHQYEKGVAYGYFSEDASVSAQEMVFK